MSIWDEIKKSFRQGSMLTKLIYINLAVFLAVNITYVFYALFVSSGNIAGERKYYFMQNWLTYFMVPASPLSLLHKPWTILTYMFLHFNFFHILFNLLWFYFFGRLFLHFLTEKQMLSTYIFGGFAGALLFILAYNLLPGLKQEVNTAEMLGASAGIMAIGMAISFYAPNYEVFLILIGRVKLKYIALFFIVTDIILIAYKDPSGHNNAGGHIAHLGGVIYAYFYILQLRRGKDMGQGFNRFLDNIVTLFSRRRNRMKVSYKKSVKDMTDMEYNRRKADTQEEIDRILDKIAKSGYDSLTKKEKETLFKMGGKN